MVNMQGRLFRPAFLAAMAVSAIVATSQSASALGYDDIAGRWCADFGSYTFYSDQLVVRFNDGTATRRYPIDNYEYRDDDVTVYWRKDSERVHTVFGDFSSNGRRMAQQANRRDNVPRREFRKC
jgi:hypothetical protein